MQKSARRAHTLADSEKRPTPKASTVRVKKRAPKSVAAAKKARSGAARALAGAARSVKSAASRLASSAREGVVKAARKSKRGGKTATGPASPRGRAPARSGKSRGARSADPSAVLERLSAAIPAPHVELAFRDPWQLLVAVILSAQSTDRRVNQVTPVLFERWPSPRALAAAAPADVEAVIKSTGFFRNKTKAIIGASAMLEERFGGRVPRSMDEMLELPGVARKTANVVLGGAHRIASGIVIDTHAARVAQRLGLTSATEPEKIEQDLCALFPEAEWIRMSHRLVLHGRYVCTARAPACSSCPLNESCPARLEPGLADWTERAAREASEMEARASGFTRV